MQESNIIEGAIERTTTANERRTSRRARMLKSGTASPDGKLAVFDCVVRNLSETGARIRVQAQQAIPNQFIFKLKDMAVDRKASVVWRHGNEIGIRFDAI